MECGSGNILAKKYDKEPLTPKGELLKSVFILLCVKDLVFSILGLEF